MLATIGMPILSENGMSTQFNRLYIPVLHAFSTMRAGNMSEKCAQTPEEGKEVTENLGRLFGRMNLGSRVRAHMMPSQSAKVVVVDEMAAAGTIEADALITFRQDVFLTLCPADCLPIIVTSKKSNFVCLVHGSKKCLEEKLLHKVVLKLLLCFDQDENDILVAMGPGIRTCHYDTDLFHLAGKQLMGNGLHIPLPYMFYAEGCTYCTVFPGTEDPMYFSHRRSEATGEEEGRFIALAARP